MSVKFLDGLVADISAGQLVTPLTIETKAQAAKANRQEHWLAKLWGNKTSKRWKVGDQYYIFIIHPENLR